MLTVETIRKIRLAAHRDKKSIHQISKDLNLARNTVRKALRSEQTVFEYERRVQPRPKLGPFTRKLDHSLEVDEKLPKKLRRTALRLFEELQLEGYKGGYDTVRRYIQRWQNKKRTVAKQVYIPLVFDPGEAFQFDWSYEKVEIAGMPSTVKVAHLRLCHSRMFLTIAYPRETQEMLFDAHMRAFEFFGGNCRRGIYDNPKTIVNKIMTGKERQFNTRFGQLCSHYLFEPIACTPAAGWEKGQVENQVGTVRRRFFVPRLKVKDFAELNEWLQSQCLHWAKTQKHPDIKSKTVWQVFEDERPCLLKVSNRFDGYAERPARVTPSSLVSFDRNRYSVDCRHAGTTVQMRVYADKIIVVRDGQIVGEHERQFGRGHTIFNPWHYLPALERKPGALRNGAPFKDWALPLSIQQIRSALQQRFSDWDRQFVSILAAVPLYGLDAVEQACKHALNEKTVSKDVVLNLIHRGRDQVQTQVIDLPSHLRLKQNPMADCRRYETLMREASNAPRG